ncbi:D-ribose pyranase [Paenibacillus zeisoli]|uniref:D-ribose pyranase n=1 Tax=Paenibacillus zeisoli TaxID=2496267 RepID=A0A433XNC4_9BACL|nr:D-ribose pyranase [Paenibacillus zeisoli]RUT35569.1 D-ribose pyranase [Paenibacillus zeisoli]
MKKHGILNSHISKILSDLGHTDYIVVADIGLPIPSGVPKIDLALTYGIPAFQQVVDLIADDMVIEKVILAEEIRTDNVPQANYMEKKFLGTPMEWCTHEKFKELSRHAKVIIRTGEATPYANCILQAGVHFG